MQLLIRQNSDLLHRGIFTNPIFTIKDFEVSNCGARILNIEYGIKGRSMKDSGVSNRGFNGVKGRSVMICCSLVHGTPHGACQPLSL